MVHTKFVARPKIPVFSSDFESMALDDAPEISTQPQEASVKQTEVPMESPQRGASTEVASPLGAKSNCES
jgi:hypothetical protein